MLSFCLTGCLVAPGGGSGGAGGGGSATTCSETRCDGERSQCVDWVGLDSQDCEDNCSGSDDILGCLQSCYDLRDARVVSWCDADFDTCTASAKVNECWDDSDPQGKCVGTSEISCADVGDQSACDTVPGCQASGTYDEYLGMTFWSCEGKPAACSDMKDAKSCRALRCTWQ